MTVTFRIIICCSNLVTFKFTLMRFSTRQENLLSCNIAIAELSLNQQELRLQRRGKREIEFVANQSQLKSVE